MEIKFKRLSEYATIPTKANPSDSGLDLYAAEDAIIAPGETILVATDLAVELPEGYEAQVRPRSGITSKTKLRVQLGTIDNGYRGNIKIIVDNIEHPEYLYDADMYEIITNYKNYCYTVSGDKHVANLFLFDVGTYIIRKGDKIAQLVVQQIPQTVAVEVTEISDADRGDNGFGHSGV